MASQAMCLNCFYNTPHAFPLVKQPSNPIKRTVGCNQERLCHSSTSGHLLLVGCICHVERPLPGKTTSAALFHPAAWIVTSFLEQRGSEPPGRELPGHLRLVSRRPTTKVCDGFSVMLLPSTYNGSPRAMATACVDLGASWTNDFD